jgi:hypothetical protein
MAGEQTVVAKGGDDRGACARASAIADGDRTALPSKLIERPGWRGRLACAARPSQSSRGVA